MAGRPHPALTPEQRNVVFASSLGTVFEWYDFFLFGVMAPIMAVNFFTALDPATRNIFTLLAFAAGFVLRPLGALVFGRLGDLVGRKYTFLVTIVLMGLSTFLIALLPTYSSVGMAAPVLLILLRLVQGLAIGGEYGGAATYVAEHAPKGRRGAFTSWIQATATVGLVLALMIVLATRTWLGDEAFAAWGWRIPYACSGFLLAVSVWIRLRLNESPAFERIRARGRRSPAPIAESFTRWPNLQLVLLALIGATAGQAVVWYTGHLYTLFFLRSFLKVDPTTAQVLIMVALVIGTPGFIYFGALSDRVGRKPVIMVGCLLAALTYFPLFQALTQLANPKLTEAIERAPVLVVAPPNDCGLLLNLTGTAQFSTGCDLTRSYLANAGVNYDKVEDHSVILARVEIGERRIAGYVGNDPDAKSERARFEQQVGEALDAAGYPTRAEPIATFGARWWLIVLILTIMVVYVAMVYGPIAALLVELFPTRIRYTSLSLPYHIGNGWIGGFLPAISFAIVAAQGNIFSGLWYPIIVAALTFVVGLMFLPETRNRNIYARD